MKKAIKGYLFISSGCEHGPQLMKWNGKWDQKKYEFIKEKSWCDNEFVFDWGFNPTSPKQRVIKWDSEKNTADTVNLNLEPGRKYRITVEEL